MKKKYRFDIKLMMADCDANYMRLCRLVPAVLNKVVSSNDNLTIAVDLATAEPALLEFTIRQQCRFTTDLNIRVQVDSFSNLEGEPGFINMAVRLYHDVKMAEVYAWNRKRSRLASYEYPNDSMFQPDEKAQQNRFLAEWLSLSLNQGLAMGRESYSIKGNQECFTNMKKVDESKSSDTSTPADSDLHSAGKAASSF